MRLAAFLTCVLSLSACGVAYHSTGVREGVVDGAKVRVIALTPETLPMANANPYRPKALPSAFHSSAGIARASTGLPLPSQVFAAPHAGQGQALALPPQRPAQAYRLGVGDVVEIASQSTAGSTRDRFTIQPDGAISSPDLGRLPLLDMTSYQAEQALISRRLERGLDAAVSLGISEHNARRISVGGEVGAPGELALSSSPLTLEAAVARAGGARASDPASARVEVSRNGTLYGVPLAQLRSLGPKITLEAGDVVEITSAFTTPEGERYLAQELRRHELAQTSRAQSLAEVSQRTALHRADLDEKRQNFATRLQLGAEGRAHVFLTGEVRDPGRMPLPYEAPLSLADALFERGGLQAGRANPRQIYVMRGSNDPREFSAITAWHLDAGQPTGWIMATRMLLQPNDVIFVAEQPVTKWSRVIDQISPSLISVPLNSVVRN